MINRKVLEIKLHCSQSGTHSCVDALTAILLPHIAVNTPPSKVFIAMLKHLVHVCVWGNHSHTIVNPQFRAHTNVLNVSYSDYTSLLTDLLQSVIRLCYYCDNLVLVQSGRGTTTGITHQCCMPKEGRLGRSITRIWSI